MSRASSKPGETPASRASRCGPVIAAILALLPAPAIAQQHAPPAPPIGQLVTPGELAGYFSIRPDGRGLPDGQGTADTGRAVYTAKCAMCHGEKLEGIKATGAPALSGGRGTLKDVPAKKTVESYWPYATTLFDYIKRAMPFPQPGSLSDDEVYALCAYILAHDKIIPDAAVMNKTTLAGVEMPNRSGFAPFDNKKILGFR